MENQGIKHILMVRDNAASLVQAKKVGLFSCFACTLIVHDSQKIVTDTVLVLTIIVCCFKCSPLAYGLKELWKILQLPVQHHSFE